MMSAEECRACSAIWLQRGKNQNISVKRAMTFLSLARTWTLVPIGNPRRFANPPPLQWKRGQSSNMPRDEGSVLHVSLASRA
jgi:hypothetical protein